MPLHRSAAKPAIALTILTLTLVLGTLVRLEDPMSTPVIAAEDPYTHMALVRDHLSDGSLDPLYENGRLYPPGMHAVVAAVWTYTGMPLDDIFRFGPVLLGTIGVAGIALLLWRCHGPVAAIVGGLAAALAPEIVFRTTMMSPTALDVAILPFFLLAVLETVRGRLAWSGVVGALSIFFVLSHPWALAVLVPTMLGIIALWAVLGGANEKSGSMDPVGAVAVLGSAAGALLIAVSTCWSQCGFGGRAAGATSDRIDQLAIAAAVAALIVAALLLILRRQVVRWHSRKRHMGNGWRMGLAALVIVALLAVSVPAFSAGFPEHVELGRMFGAPILALAAVGIIVLAFLPSRAAFAGAALLTVTYPFVIYNVFDSPYWPHRTAVYMGIAMTLLVGIGASAIVMLVRQAVEQLPVRKRSGTRGVAQRAMLASIAALVATTMLAGSVYAKTPLAYETGWYRLYPECEYEGLRSMALEQDPDTIIITGDWRPKLVMAAFAADADNVWYDRAFFTDPQHREDTMIGLELDGRDIVVVVDRHMKLEHPEADTSFLHSDPWTQLGPWCSGGAPGERLNAYTTEGRA